MFGTIGNAAATQSLRGPQPACRWTAFTPTRLAVRDQRERSTPHRTLAEIKPPIGGGFAALPAISLPLDRIHSDAPRRPRPTGAANAASNARGNKTANRRRLIYFEGRDRRFVKDNLLIPIAARTVEKDSVFLLFPNRRKFRFARTMKAKHHAARNAVRFSENIFRSRKGVGQKFVVVANGLIHETLKVVQRLNGRNITAHHGTNT